MQITIDTENNVLTKLEAGAVKKFPLYSDESFEILSDQWLKIGWNQKYSYTFSWLGRPVIQLPEDMIRMQEVIYQLKPDVLIETGVAHGGSLIFYASLFQSIQKGRVIGVDIDIRPHNRQAIEAHVLSPIITLIEGSCIENKIVEKVQAEINDGELVMVILDSCHTKEHVAAELEKYSKFVSPGFYIVVTDGVMKDLHNVPRGNRDWLRDNPTSAALEFARHNPDFEIVQPKWQFNESNLKKTITYLPGAWLKRKKLA